MDTHRLWGLKMGHSL